jgi:medium-chain acyl-[acyl-carrier-protein] hydrolase
LPTSWIVTPRPNRALAVRLICVPHAGGGVATFRGWQERLGLAELGVVQMPGRGSRLREPAVQSLADAAAGVVDSLLALPQYPTVLFGHSLGALIAFEAARGLRDQGWPLLALFVSGRRAPFLADPLGPLATLPTDDFVREVRRRYDAVPDAVLADADMMKMLVPGLRADFAMLEGYRYEPAAPLPGPIIALGGSSDPHATLPELEAWRRETRARFSVHTFEGGHFYVQQEREAVTALISNQLSVLVGAMSRWAGVNR